MDSLFSTHLSISLDLMLLSLPFCSQNSLLSVPVATAKFNCFSHLPVMPHVTFSSHWWQNMMLRVQLMLNPSLKKIYMLLIHLAVMWLFMCFLQTLTLVLMYYNSGLNDGTIWFHRSLLERYSKVGFWVLVINLKSRY